MRDEAQHREAFSEAAGYLSRMPRGLCSGERWFSDYGPELSRGFRALKVWMCLKQHGLRKYGELFEQNVEQTGYLAGLVESTRELELMARGELNIVCFRYRGRVPDEQALNVLNRERQARQYIGFLDFNRLQGLRIKSQGLQYRRRDLRGCHRSLHHAGVQPRV